MRIVNYPLEKSQSEPQKNQSEDIDEAYRPKTRGTVCLKGLLEEVRHVGKEIKPGAMLQLVYGQDVVHWKS